MVGYRCKPQCFIPRKRFRTLLEDAEWVKWSDNHVAEQCGVSATFVGTVRASLSTVDSEKASERVYTTKHSKQPYSHRATPP